GTILMTIADLSVMEVEVEVDETDVIGVEIGQQAEVRVDAFPDLTIKGKVTEIGSSALQKVTSSEESRDLLSKLVTRSTVPLKNIVLDLSIFSLRIRPAFLAASFAASKYLSMFMASQYYQLSTFLSTS
ncbi:unnamed protein product, partial [marine sediment metagenome]